MGGMKEIVWKWKVYGTIGHREIERYDMVDLRALKSWRDGQLTELNLMHGTE